LARPAGALDDGGGGGHVSRATRLVVGPMGSIGCRAGLAVLRLDSGNRFLMGTRSVGHLVDLGSPAHHRIHPLDHLFRIPHSPHPSGRTSPPRAFGGGLGNRGSDRPPPGRDGHEMVSRNPSHVSGDGTLDASGIAAYGRRSFGRFRHIARKAVQNNKLPDFRIMPSLRLGGVSHSSSRRGTYFV